MAQYQEAAGSADGEGRRREGNNTTQTRLPSPFFFSSLLSRPAPHACMGSCYLLPPHDKERETHGTGAISLLPRAPLSHFSHSPVLWQYTTTYDKSMSEDAKSIIAKAAAATAAANRAGEEQEQKKLGSTISLACSLGHVASGRSV